MTGWTVAGPAPRRSWNQAVPRFVESMGSGESGLERAPARDPPASHSGQYFRLTDRR
jgi:hypothetical protein